MYYQLASVSARICPGLPEIAVVRHLGLVIHPSWTTHDVLLTGRIFPAYGLIIWSDVTDRDITIIQLFRFRWKMSIHAYFRQFCGHNIGVLQEIRRRNDVRATSVERPIDVDFLGRGDLCLSTPIDVV